MEIKLENIKPLSVNKAWKGQKYKSGEYQAFEEEVLYKLPSRTAIEGDIEVEYKFYLTGRSYELTDVDNLIKALQDILQKDDIIENDNKIIRLTAEKIKSDRNRIEIKIDKYE